MTATQVIFGACYTYDPDKPQVYTREKGIVKPDKGVDWTIEILTERAWNFLSQPVDEIVKAIEQLEAEHPNIDHDRIPAGSQFPNVLELSVSESDGDVNDAHSFKIVGRQLRKFTSLDQFNEIVLEMIEAVKSGEDNFKDDLR